MRKIKCFISKILIAGLLHQNYVFANTEQAPLKINEVHRLMDEIFKQHVSQKGMSAAILKNSFKIYIEQFDPDHIYLLEREVAPYLYMNDEEVNKMLAGYERRDLTPFVNLNDTIKNSILRARKIRSEIGKSQLFTKSVREEANQAAFFAENEKELKDKIALNYVQYLQNEARRYGQAKVDKNQDKLFKAYDQERKYFENQYLGESNGTPISAEEQENLFALHLLKAISKSLDAHTNFLNTDEAFELKIKLEKSFEGIGVRLQKQKGQVIIVDLLEGSPAAKNGSIKIGDQILEIDNKSINGLSLAAVLELLRNPNSKVLNLKIQHYNGTGEAKVENIELDKTVIAINEGRVQSSYEKIGNGIIGKIEVPAFYRGARGVSTENDVRSAIEQLKKEGNLQGLILDLRYNSGGFLTQAVKVAGLFVTSGIIVISKYANGDERIYRDIDGKKIYNGPLVVLTSRQTASAAEIVAQALQDYGVALIVGDEHTYGKGTIQSQTVTGSQNSPAYFKVTVGKYYTVSGKTPQLKGVIADIHVPSQLEDEVIGEEYLQYALPSDTIPPSYVDHLADIEAGLKPWFLHYYAPTIQNKLTTWQRMLPVLKKNSNYRVANNKVYQTLLHQPIPRADEDDVTAFRQQAPISSDFQIIEAVNIIKDMIYLQGKELEKLG